MDGVKPRLPSVRRFDGVSLNSPPLLRCLAGLGVAEVAASTLSLAERWSLWLAWTDAIRLSAVLGSGAPAAPASARPDAHAVAADCQRVRQDLSQAIVTNTTFRAGLANATPLPADSSPLDDSGRAHLQRLYQAQQGAMDERIAPMRARVQAALSRQSGDLARLAALDAVLDEALAARQRRLLATVPGWLDRHFKRAPTTAPAAAAELQRLLLAELDLRLQPVEAMTAALAQAAGRHASNPVADRATHPATLPATRAATHPARNLARPPA